MQTRHGFDEQLREVRTNVLRLAALAREAVTAATEALLAGEAGTVEAVLRVDEEIDDLVAHLENQCFEMMARQQPMASDLRTLVAVLRVIHELELTGDLMTSVASASGRLRVMTLNPRLRGILARMGAQVGEQLDLAAKAFDECDIGAVDQLEQMDDGMSEMSRELFAVLFDLGTGEADALRRAVDLALVARFFQRAADHAVNVGARVRYMVVGEMPAPHPVRDVVGP
ncbi:MAG: phosphate transport system regulatory protein PhoU [Acidimicrobiales bacterium]|jgi:phosphate transport system protein|nr:phosphate transport system regulatory protein PhoU [Acidimicrobiales bacterium]